MGGAAASIVSFQGRPNQALHLTGAAKPAPAGELGRSCLKDIPANAVYYPITGFAHAKAPRLGAGRQDNIIDLFSKNAPQPMNRMQIMTKEQMSYGDLRDRVVNEALDANKQVIHEFINGSQFRAWATGERRDGDGLEWEAVNIPNTQVVTVYPTDLEIYTRLGRVVFTLPHFFEPTQLLRALCDLAEMLSDLRRKGKNLQSVEATTVYFAVKRTGRDGMLREDLANCVSQSQFEDEKGNQRPFVPRDQVDNLIREMVTLGVFNFNENGDRVSVAPQYLV